MKLSLPVAVLLCFTAAAQQPQFKSGVQLLTIEASVHDRSGSPVHDLKPSDFSVTIDGKPRTVVFAHFFHAETATVAATNDPTAGRYVSNTDSAATGKVVVFAIDRDALPPGTERPILESAAAMLDRLSPADAIGLVEIPGRSFDLTRDRPRIANVLRSIVGTPPPRTSARNVSWDEAKAFERGEKTITAAVMDRECRVGDSFCPGEVQTRVREVLTYERTHVQTLLAALTSVMTQLESVRGAKHLVLLSAGLPLDAEFLDRYNTLERAAAYAHVTVDTIRLHQFTGDASSDAKGGSGQEDPGVGAGMDSIATMTGGRAYAPSGTGMGTLERIASDVTSFYQLGVESVPGDANGKLHDVKVRVNRPDTETIARPHVAASTPVQPDRLLDTALKQPVDDSSVPIAASAYGMFTASGGDRLIVASEIGAPGGGAPVEWGAVVIRDGASIASTRGRIPTGPERPQIVVATPDVAGGSYRVRVAAVDVNGAIGSLELPVRAGGHDAPGGARISDLILGVTTGKELEPRSRLADNDEITALLQVTGSSTAPTGVLEFTALDGASVAGATAFTVVATGSGTFTLQAHIAPGALSSGARVAVATVRAGDIVIGRVSRAVHIMPGAAPVQSEKPSSTPTVPVEPLRTDATALDIMNRVGGYVERYGDAASAIIGIERYSQRSEESEVGVLRARGLSDGRMTYTANRTLTSELALVRNPAAPGGWLAFRDVIEVDGKPVPDRQNRLRALFDSGSPDLETARRIGDESSRFNVGLVTRTFNVPTAALFFFTPANLRRFSFKNRGSERVDGVEARVIEFRETAKPTLVMTRDGQDVPSSGQLWIDPVDGHVIKTMLTLTGYAGLRSSAAVEVTYRHDADFGMWLPVEMRETYVTRAGSITATAQYADFRRFQTSAKIKKSPGD